MENCMDNEYTRNLSVNMMKSADDYAVADTIKDKLITKTITENDTYNASDDGADGYSSVTVNVAAPTPETFEVEVSVDQEAKVTFNKTYSEIKTAIDNNKIIVGNVSILEAVTANIAGFSVCDIVKQSQVQASNAITVITEVFPVDMQGTGQNISTVLAFCIITSENDTSFGMDVVNI